MKISFFITQDLNSPSGLGRFFPWAKEMSKLNYEIKVFALHADYSNLPRKKENIKGVKVNYIGQMHVKKIGNSKTYFPIWKLLCLLIVSTGKFIFYSLFDDYDVLIIGKPHPMNGIAGIIAKIFRRKKILVDIDDLEVSSNHFQKNWQRRIVQYFENKLPFFADLIVTNTKFTKNRLLKAGIPEDIIYLLPNGIDHDRFGEVNLTQGEILKNQLGLSEKKIIGYIGTISLVSHPIEILLEALAKLKSLIPDIHLIIVGGGEDLSKIQQIIRDLEIQNIVTIVGRVEPMNIYNYYKICDVTVDPVYNNDTAKARLPLKMFESWAVGVPFVTSDVGDRKFYLSNPLTGLVAEDDNPNELVKVIYKVLSDERLRNKIIENGISKSKEFYWDILSRNFLNFLNERFFK